MLVDVRREPSLHLFKGLSKWPASCSPAAASCPGLSASRGATTGGRANQNRRPDEKGFPPSGLEPFRHHGWCGPGHSPDCPEQSSFVCERHAEPDGHRIGHHEQGGHLEQFLRSGGLSPEGGLYNTSQGFTFDALHALHTAGVDDSAVYGPQVNLISSGYWSLAQMGALSALAPQPWTGQPTWGQLWPFCNYGDLQHLYILLQHASLWLGMGMYDTATGNTARLAQEWWFLYNVPQGGPSGSYGACPPDCH